MKGLLSDVKLNLVEFSSGVRPFPVKRIEIQVQNCVYFFSVRKVVYNEEFIWADEHCTIKDLLDVYKRVRSNKTLGHN